MACQRREEARWSPAPGSGKKGERMLSVEKGEIYCVAKQCRDALNCGFATFITIHVSSFFRVFAR
jgi:hypothetical protein